ncbi:RES family NAD+ phosphorylase [Nocardioides sp. Iso805N]|uniref:RES family NAD+ phosphorylase n=1 Tax=Nocardioides sp. Iso805N TaxID=1283287 RepID=UPI00036CB926|nr:RES family NAD+ phosphorylase [Nocardioides sp. Iso805N]
MTPNPPHPFNAEIETLASGALLYRVHSNNFGPYEFNPGKGAPTRFAFFADEHGATVPILYAAAGQPAAVAESLLHDIPATGGLMPYDTYAPRVMSRLSTSRPLRLGALHGLGLRALRVTAEQVTASAASTYDRTVLWAKAAHRAGLDGLVWMSRQCNDTLAYAFFGDRCEGAFDRDPTFARIFATGNDLLWLIDMCAPLGVDVLPPPA